MPSFSLDDSGAKASEQKTLQVLELDPNFVPALQRYGKFRWLIDGKLAEAIQIIEHAIALDPKNSLLLHIAMAVYLDLGDAKAARAVVAGMPQSARAVGLLAMHEGDWRRAGLSAYDEAGWTSDDDYCEIWQGEALRDYALKTGELSRAIAFIKLKYYLGDAPAAHLDVCNYGAAVYLSQLLAAAGQAEQAALALRRAASSWNDANEAKYLGRFTPPARRGSAARRQTGRGARRAGGIIPFRVLRALVVHHKLRSLVVAAARRRAIPGHRRRRAPLCRRAAQPARSAAPTRGRAEARRPGRCALNRGSRVSEREYI